MAIADILAWLQKEWFGVFGLILSVVLSYHLFFKGKKDRLPCCMMRSYNVMHNAHVMFPGLTLHFDGYGSDITTFTLTRCIIWNKGQEVIRKTDVAEPLAINAVGDTVILSAEIATQSNDKNSFKCTVAKDKKSAGISFNYLDQGQYAVVQIAHTGVRSKDLVVTGTIIGAPNSGGINVVSVDGLRQFNSPRRNVMLASEITILFFQILLTASATADYFARRERFQYLTGLNKELVDLSFSLAALRLDPPVHVPVVSVGNEPTFPFWAVTIAVSAALVTAFQIYWYNKRIAPKKIERLL